MKTRLAAGEKLGRKRMAVLGAVWDSPTAPRTVDDVIAGPDTDTCDHRERADGPKASNKWLTASVAPPCGKSGVRPPFGPMPERRSGATAM